ncbi:uncharacterized protein K452DRAFT_247695 [Aplosporella prunicola CBS 121167]|uniref:Mcm2 3 5 family protein n=1 Tax=Aplosporella prunicola CBS 121167 TaxID=1176127 RepID=A0A6A6BGK9_9PEZI|nr:uncharacterized protein K452DRAFT_247695 [Aplosporella prunicola CBS 121167]KAF2143279.1 hypothetical protein K452DRAFT_247695 [Aplosporella prunicola CBS 121167]
MAGDDGALGGGGGGKKELRALPSLPPVSFVDTGRPKPSPVESRDGLNSDQPRPVAEQFYQRRNKWLALSVILLTAYSTVFSGIFLGIALSQPRWHFISDTGALSPANASLLTAIVAKSIEMCFVTAFVAFLGQVLSRRSIEAKDGGTGVTLADMSMRNWIMQPGLMVTHWETVKYAGLSTLGVLAFLAAIGAMLYTTASDALVQPQLKYGDVEQRVMSGEVWTSFANAAYIQGQCETPIDLEMDPLFRNSTCLGISYAAKTFHDYQQYMARWYERARNTSYTDVSVDKNARISGYSLLNSTTIVNGSWLEVTAKEVDGRIVNNVSLAMPHVGVQQAAADKRNKILQPQELNGLGAYTLVGSTASPVIHVLCANLDREELAPLVYEAWNHTQPLDPLVWPAQINQFGKDDWLNSTVVDDLFGWGKRYDEHAPIFAKYPMPYNTLMGDPLDFDRNSIYILSRDNDETQERYSLCQLKTSLTPNCSTTYSAALEGSSLSATCDPEKDEMAYIHSNPGAAFGHATESSKWPWVGSAWASSISLNAGISDGKASDARLLTQLMLREAKLNPKLPSIAEALAVMASSTLLTSIEDSTFSTTWNHTSASLDVPETQYFNATLRAREYASGPVGDAQKALHLILLLVFLINLISLSYFLMHRGALVTDVSEPPNLFSLAVNSPPAANLVGAVGVGGPERRQYKVQWIVDKVEDTLRMRPMHADEIEARRRRGMYNLRQQLNTVSLARGNTVDSRESGIELVSPVASVFSRLSKKKSFA